MPPRRRTPKRTRCMATNINRPCIRATGRLFFCQFPGSFSDIRLWSSLSNASIASNRPYRNSSEVSAPNSAKLYASQRQTEAELHLFKNEMRDFKDESRRSFGR